MYNTVQGDVVFFLACVAAGALSAFLYDLIRISRRIVKINVSAVCGEDIAFFALAAVIVFYVAYTKNSGEVRWQGLLGSLLGAGGYVFLVRNRFVNLGTTVIKWIIKALLAVLWAVLFPVKIVFKAIKKPVEIVAWYTGAGLRRARRVAKSGKAKVKLRLRAARSLVKKK